MDLEVIRPGKSPDDEIHERAGVGDALRHAVIEVRMGVEQPHSARLRTIPNSGREITISAENPLLTSCSVHEYS